MYILYLCHKSNSIQDVNCPKGVVDVILSDCDVNPCNNRLFGYDCDKCGLTITFADDASIVLKCKRGEDNVVSTHLDRLLAKLELFLREKSKKS